MAFLLVFFSHVRGLTFFPGGFGVTVFFFLSGFLITTLLRLEGESRGNISLRQFYLRRVLRIFPPMYLSLALAVVLSVMVHAPVSPRLLLIQTVQFTNYLVALERVGEPLGTTVLWSLSVEEHFYLLFPLFFIALRRVLPDPRRQAAVLLAGCGVLLAWRCALVFALHMGSNYMMHATDTRIDSILFGCVLALVKNPALPGEQLGARWVWPSFVAALVVLCATIAARGVPFRETLRYSLQGVALAPVFIAVVRFPQALLFRPLNWRPVRFLGVLSYSLYLVHDTVMEFLRRWMEAPEAVVAAVGLVAAILLATAMHYGVERPCARARRRLARIPLIADR